MTTTTTAPAASQPALRAVELRYGIYLARFDVHVTVSPDGLLRSVRTDGKSYGSGDIDPKLQRVEIREGRLTEAQMADLAHHFAGWHELSSQPYPELVDGGELSIRYGEKTVSGNEVPRLVTDVRTRLMELAASMPVVKPAPTPAAR
jgi:hypothetical protein